MRRPTMFLQLALDSAQTDQQTRGADLVVAHPIAPSGEVADSLQAPLGVAASSGRPAGASRTASSPTPRTSRRHLAARRLPLVLGVLVVHDLRLRRQVRHDVPKAAPPRQLRHPHPHRDELATASACPASAPSCASVPDLSVRRGRLRFLGVVRLLHNHTPTGIYHNCTFFYAPERILDRPNRRPNGPRTDRSRPFRQRSKTSVRPRIQK